MNRRLFIERIATLVGLGAVIPQDEYGIQLGTFKVTIEWSEDK